MKITKLTTYRLPPRWMFLKIETDEGGCWLGRAGD
ncbi:galactonate dehydratase [Enterobacter cancerogenus]|uniref:Galactonate dehydratase n=1 Tax=Enterobacter cancerogenus TaxID=69218 RepID=A0A484WWJ3_9ENTR|nr:galactonate dehydratase [Enterobacter cancerogenus]